MEMTITFEGKAKVIAEYDGMKIETDQPFPSGDGSAPTPFNLFLASLGTCAGIYVKSFCDQRNIPTKGIKITQRMQYNPTAKLISEILIDIQLPADFPEKYKTAVINASDLCAVKRHLHNPPVIKTIVSTL
ncbi:MAG: osmotically inducible protein C [Bacteroidetes bacterium HGW-Bacteroidetes-21]|jgi:ribosomal protein S12 methylthiotransferase accessory factor|nr:MAG: osmotically inducible protein C [Bacteroidetes bacterium HGW-Bacteroidetes-21]